MATPIRFNGVNEQLVGPLVQCDIAIDALLDDAARRNGCGLRSADIAPVLFRYQLLALCCPRAASR
jgi:hypothetical protein